jgi:hypothetical protein
VAAKCDDAMTVVRERVSAGECRIRCRVNDDAASDASEGRVRMEKRWGSWRFEALEAKS